MLTAFRQRYLFDYPPLAILWWSVISICGLVTIAAALVDVSSLAVEPLYALIWVLLACVSSMFPIKPVGNKLAISTGELMVFIAFLQFGMTAAILTVAITTATAALVSSKRLTSWVFTPCSSSLSFAIISGILTALQPIFEKSGASAPLLSVIFISVLFSLLEGFNTLYLFSLKSKKPFNGSELYGVWSWVFIVQVTFAVIAAAISNNINVVNIFVSVAAMFTAVMVLRANYIKQEISKREHQKRVQEAEDEIKYLAFNDQLTGLSNRATYNLRMRAMLGQLQHNSGAFAVVFIDLDRFKVVNDSLGHTAGDELLKAVAERLRQMVRTGDVICRLGGDEFCAILNDVDEMTSLRFAERIVAALETPFVINATEINISVSIGIRLVDDSNASAEDILHDADSAMYTAKRGGSTIKIFSKYNDTPVQKLDIEKKIRDALKNDTLTAVFQPIVETADGKISTFELLLRSNIGIDTYSLIVLAEESKLIRDITSWSINKGLLFLSQVHDDIRLHINISPRALDDDDFISNFSAALRRSSVKPHRIILEITESAAVSDIQRNHNGLERLIEIGVEIAIDDFGMGYSSLSHLSTIPFKHIKIDKVFIDKIPGSSHEVEIVKFIVALALALDKHITAEGVETEEQFEFLKNLGVHSCQGYLISKPISMEDAIVCNRQVI